MTVTSIAEFARVITTLTFLLTFATLVTHPSITLGVCLVVQFCLILWQTKIIKMTGPGVE